MYDKCVLHNKKTKFMPGFNPSSNYSIINSHSA